MNWSCRVHSWKGKKVTSPVGQCSLFWQVSILAGAAGCLCLCARVGQGVIFWCSGWRRVCVWSGGGRKRGWMRTKYFTLIAEMYYMKLIGGKLF